MDDPWVNVRSNNPIWLKLLTETGIRTIAVPPAQNWLLPKFTATGEGLLTARMAESEIKFSKQPPVPVTRTRNKEPFMLDETPFSCNVAVVNPEPVNEPTGAFMLTQLLLPLVLICHW